jgi:hypothetical protein
MEWTRGRKAFSSSVELTLIPTETEDIQWRVLLSERTGDEFEETLGRKCISYSFIYTRVSERTMKNSRWLSGREAFSYLKVF